MVHKSKHMVLKGSCHLSALFNGFVWGCLGRLVQSGNEFPVVVTATLPVLQLGGGVRKVKETVIIFPVLALAEDEWVPASRLKEMKCGRLTGTLATRKQSKWLHAPGGLYRAGNVHILRGVTSWNDNLRYCYRELKYIFF